MFARGIVSFLFSGLLLIDLTTGRALCDEPTAVAPSVRLTPAEQQLVRDLEKRLSTKLQSKENNPADQHTWYVLMFRDVAIAETSTTTGTKSNGVLRWTKGKSKQTKTSEDAVLIQGRKEAAIVVGRYVTSPNAAAAQLKASNGAPPPGWMKKSDTKLGGDRDWDYRAFNNETDAKAFLESVKPAKK